jgi:type II secretory pathway component PulM
VTSLPALLDSSPWWQHRAPRERLVLAVGAAFLAAAAAYAWIIGPMFDTLAAAPAHRAERAARAAVASAQLEGIHAPAGTVTASDAATPRRDPRAAVEQTLRERGLMAVGATLDVQDGRVLVTLPSVSLGTLVAALDTLQRSDGLRVIAATLTPLADRGLRAELTLAR